MVSVSVVDGPEGESTVEKALHIEARKTILSGAAIFFPDKLVRREKLFHMMVSIESFHFASLFALNRMISFSGVTCLYRKISRRISLSRSK